MDVRTVDIRSATVQFSGAAKSVYRDLSLLLPAGQWTCLLGASGCGKSTLLRQLAGLIETQHEQTLELANGALAASLSSNIAYMAQQDLLLPWLSILENACLGQRLQRRRIDTETRERALQLLASLGLADVADKRPEVLSGGMRQRAALARTLMLDRTVVLMDEPFSALDAVNRHKLQALAAERLAGKTVLLVTHDPQEALRLGHHIVLMSNGELQTLDCPASATPRAIDSDLAVYQQQLLNQLGAAA